MIVIKLDFSKGCNWHKGEEPIAEDETVGCTECGRLIATKECPSCHGTFLDWNSNNLDDIIAPPGVTASGDFMCRWCARRYDEEEEWENEKDTDYFEDPIEEAK